MSEAKYSCLVAALILILTAAAAHQVKAFTASKVVDAKGRVVGTLFPAASSSIEDQTNSTALVGINGKLYLLNVGVNGFTDTHRHFYWVSGSCVGAPLMADESHHLYADAAASGNVMYFAQGPFSSMQVNSDSTGEDPEVAASGCENPSNQQTLSVGAVGTFDLTKLGFKTPFKAK